MSNAGRKRKVVEPNEYLNERNENIMENMRRMEELNILPTAQQLNALQQVKRKKKTTNQTPVEANTIGRNLRSNSRISAPHVDTQNHTTGSKSHARVGTEMGEELGRRPHRDELFIKTHTHKNGVPHKGAVTTINALEDAIRDNPALKERSIQEGDAYSYVCGAEKNGYVRVVGLGPSPADLEMPGARKYTSTRLQMEIEARRQSDKRVKDLTNRLDIIQQTLDRLMQQQNANSTPHGSNNAPQNLRNAPTYHDEVHEEDQEQDARSYAGDDMADMHLDDDNDFLSRRVVLREEQHSKGGRDVILYNVVRPYEVAVAKATVQTNNPRAIVGGTALGVQYCEVVVNHVFMRNAVLLVHMKG